MRRMVVGVAVLALCLGTSLVLAGTEGGGDGAGRGARGGRAGGAGGRGGMLERLQNELGLSAEQVEKIRALQPELQKKMEEAGQDREKRQAAFTWYQDEMKKAMTAEQVKKFEERMNQPRQAMGGIGALGPMMRLDMALGRLQLPEATRTKVESLRKERDAKVEAAQNTFKDQVMPLLTPEQQEQVKQALEQQPGMGGFGARGGTPGGAGPQGNRGNRGTRGNRGNRGGNGGGDSN